MKILEFEVDQNLKVLDFNGDFGRLNIPHSRSFYSSPYYELLPRIYTDNNDIVESVIKNGIPVFLEGYRFGCFLETLAADVRVFPVKDQNNNTLGARVSLCFRRESDFFDSYKKSKHLIDIGKNASILAHGVRNPLNAIKGAVAYLRNRFAGEQILLEFTDIIEEEISRLDKFITEFLSASNNKIEKKTVQIKEILNKVEKIVSLQAGTDDIEIIFDNSCEFCVDVNLFQVEHAILNVINNAIKAVRPKGKIIVSCKEEVRNNTHFGVVEILDDGCGFSQSFDKMDSSSLEMFAEGHGKGFGLFISREVMKHHGGVLEIKSEKGKGTMVRLCLLLRSPKEH